MKEIHVDSITAAVKELCMTANYDLGQDVVDAFKSYHESEASPTGKGILEQLLENAEIAKNERVPMCQDTGYAVFFVELGQDVHIQGGTLTDAINEGVRQGYTDGYLRKSIVEHPLNRKNTGDNTPAVIHIDLVSGNEVKITIAPKGGGSENMSGIKMLKPADGVEGVKNFVIQRVREAGPNPCPPIVVGVGIGGTFEKSALLAKKSLLRNIGERHADPEIAALEVELLTKINKLGIGPQGLGGTTTALDVFIDVYPAHIASLPVAVNINCHAARHKSVKL
ncbi:fumarate hydratase [Desulfuribacillus stibiiarsenatis]|uniref:Fumarate hydratase n=1 Tax=Desulfuribacillus stibiiarsenatis TaxID=1390249 RepID=A0A1E5L2W2_9FIRM|nr:fumarate hydratase [Desulfuribacillus stibiiarsenatis]OEH84462.1 fumarate hydratase [Desulfuribacillus stibiiarsenatis]